MSSANPDETPRQPSSERSLAEVALVFLRLGTTAFGGPAAHVAMMEQEFVRRRQWLSHQRFLDMLGAVNLIPGPNSTEMAIYIGYLRAGWPGLLLGGICFVLPAMLLVAGLAWGYAVYGNLPQITGLLRGVKPVVIAIIVQALAGLGPKAVKTPGLGLIAAGALAASLLGLDPLSVVLICGAAQCVLRSWRSNPASSRWTLAGLLLVVCGILVIIHHTRFFPVAHPAAAGGALPEANHANTLAIFSYFLKIGAILYGSGYVLLAFLQGDLVPRWLSMQQLLDATSVGQVTPGPLFTTATFIGFILGYQSGGPLGGWLGALAGTIGIFLPSFVYIALGGALFPRLRESPVVGSFLDGVNVGAMALIAAMAWTLGREALVDIPTWAIGIVSGLLLFRFRLNSAWLILAGAGIGVVMALWGA
jgi:chromate transporter